MSESVVHFVLSRVSAFESSGLVVVDRQEMKEYGTEEEVAVAFQTFSLAEFAAEYRQQLSSNERLLAVSKVVSLCEPDGRIKNFVREDYNLLDNSLRSAQ